MAACYRDGSRAAHAMHLPSIMKVLGLTSWQGVVTVIMLSGSFPCNHNDSFTQVVDADMLYANSSGYDSC